MTYSVFQPEDSFLHHLHPLTKLLTTILVVLSAYLLSGVWTPLILLLVLAALAYTAHVAKSFLRTLLIGLIPIALSLFLIQGVFFPPSNSTPIQIGSFILRREGFIIAFITGTRLLAFSAAILLLLRVTHPADLVTSLTQVGLPRNVGYILLVTLQIAPDISARATAILEAQRSRGLETERGLFRFGALFPLFGPLVVGALADVEERAMALESRAFFASGPKTTLRVLTDSTAQRVARLLLLLAIAGLIIARFTVLRGLL